MGLFDKIKGPVFLKETSNAAEQILRLQELLSSAPAECKEQIERDIKLLQTGIYGEEAIAFELKNSHMPMMILHDLYLKQGEFSAQIDYLIVTRKRIFVIECKNLFGNIEINSSGDFIRTVQYGKRSFREGVYSPVTQNKRHLELLHQLRREVKGNVITKAIFDQHFYDTYRSVVVLANPKTVLNARYAPKAVKSQVIRADGLIEYIRKVNAEPGTDAMSEQQMETLARFYLDLHAENPVDYTEKYQKSPPAAETVEPPAAQSSVEPAPIICPRCGAPMVIRKAAKGPNAGKTFYGCTRYPQCRGIVNIQQ